MFKIIKKVTFTVIAVMGFSSAIAHSIDMSESANRTWRLSNGTELVKGSFLTVSEGKVLVETQSGSVKRFDISALCDIDKQFVELKRIQIERINNQIVSKHHQAFISQSYKESPVNFSKSENWLLVMSILILIGLIAYLPTSKLKMMPLSLVAILVISSFGNNPLQNRSTTNPGFLDSSFSYFKPTINTRYDNTWFYVESKGIPDHEMMLGITGWQQQVPIPQCYIGSNAWSIPLNPVMATTPVPVNNKHFLRGAVAIAVNGIPIFNPYTNTGVDAFLDGQLDQYGGHSGRADDYHYHIAPMVLYNKVPETLPIAFALDGFAIFGNKEPDGSAMKTLDANHGHTGSDGRYHYHASSSAPYMIGNMVGKVTEDTTMQIIPQATAKPVRPSTTPLKGAKILHCIPYNTNNGYVLTWEINSQVDTVDYHWDAAGKYTYTFYANNTTTVNNYNGKPNCTVPVTSSLKTLNKSLGITLFPNPGSEIIHLKCNSEGIKQQIKMVSIYDIQGKRVYQNDGYVESISAISWPRGFYLVQISTSGDSQIEKIMIH